MERLERPTLIAVVGWAGSGKSSVAEIIRRPLGCHLIDQDATRTHFFGAADPHPDISPERQERIRLEMKATYEILRHAADYHLQFRNSLILVACYSSVKAQDDLRFLMEKHPGARFKTVWCYPENDSEEEVTRRLADRRREGNYLGGMNSYSHYVETKKKFVPLTFPHVRVDTSPPQTPADCAEQALTYIREP